MRTNGIELRIGRTLGLVLWFSMGTWASGDTVTIRQGAGARQLVGNVVRRDERTGTMLFETRDGRQYRLPPTSIVDHKVDTNKVRPFGPSELREALAAEYGPKFKIETTAHFLIVYNCTPRMAKDTGVLLEKTWQAFANAFPNQPSFRFQTPSQPLIAVLLASENEFRGRAQLETGEQPATNVVGLYSYTTNRIYLYEPFPGFLDFSKNTNRVATVRSDLEKAKEQLDQERYRASSARAKGEIEAREKELQSAEKDLRKYSKEISANKDERRAFAISTIVHEGIHMLAFNGGIHHRNADDPRWLIEGLAMHFEAPDLRTQSGWNVAGGLNPTRARDFRRSFAQRQHDSLTEMVVRDSRLLNRDALEKYAETWAFTYFLTQTRLRNYVDYLAMVHRRPLTRPYTAEARLADFRKAFGKAPGDFEPEFSAFFNRVVFPQVK